MVETAIKVIFSDEIIERLIDLVMDAQQKENTRLPVLKDQLRDTEKRLANLLEAIEQGIRPRPPSSGWTNWKPGRKP